MYIEQDLCYVFYEQNNLVKISSFYTSFQFHMEDSQRVLKIHGFHVNKQLKSFSWLTQSCITVGQGVPCMVEYELALSQAGCRQSQTCQTSVKLRTLATFSINLCGSAWICLLCRFSGHFTVTPPLR